MTVFEGELKTNNKNKFSILGNSERWQYYNGPGEQERGDVFLRAGKELLQ